MKSYKKRRHTTKHIKKYKKNTKKYMHRKNKRIEKIPLEISHEIK
jgi:hypothetical protein